MIAAAWFLGGLCIGAIGGYLIGAIFSVGRWSDLETRLLDAERDLAHWDDHRSPYWRKWDR